MIILRRYRVLIGLLALTVLMFVGLLFAPRADGQLIGSDGVGYYIYLRSFMLDGDLDFHNEYAYFLKSGAIKTIPLTSDGTAANKYALGVGVLWSPFFLLAHLIAVIGRGLGFKLATDGYSWLYQGAISFGSIVYGVVGMALAVRCVQRFYQTWISNLAAVLFWLAGNAVYYAAFEPSMAHMVALFTVSALLSFWFLRLRRDHAPTWRESIMFGILVGLVLLVRLQAAVVLLIPALDGLYRLWQARDSSTWRGWLRHALVASLIAFVVFAPQLLAWRTIYGVWISPYLDDHQPAFYWTQPHLVEVLFSTFHGLLSWHPVYALALLGIVSVWRHDRWLTLGMIAVLGLNWYIVAAWWSWWQGDSFGGRMFIDFAWLWLFGLTGCLSWLARRRVVLVGIMLVLIGWNGLSLVQYRLGFVPMSQPLTWRQMTIDRIMLPFKLLNNGR